MIEKITDFLDDHPGLYLVGAAIFIATSVMYMEDARDCVVQYRRAKAITREVSEALGG